MKRVFTDNAETRLATDASAGDTVIVLENAANFASPASGEYQIVCVQLSDGTILKLKSIGKSADVLTLDAALSVDLTKGLYVWAPIDAESVRLAYAGYNGSITETTSFTLDSSYLGSLIICDSGSAQVVTVPDDAAGGFSDREFLSFWQKGVGQLQFSPATGVVINSSQSLNSRGQYSMLTLVHVGANEWVLVGDREPV